MKCKSLYCKKEFISYVDSKSRADLASVMFEFSGSNNFISPNITANILKSHLFGSD